MDRPSRVEGELAFEGRPDPFEVPAPARREAAPAPVPTALAASALAARKPARFAGLTYAQLGLMAAALAAAMWGLWATSKILALDDRRVVSVRLAAIVNDFVTAEARSGTPPDQLTARTRAFMGALDSVLKSRAADGQVVLVGEAVVAASVPDVTMEVVADLAQLVKMRPPAAMPPRMAAPMAATVMPQAAPAPSQIPLTAPAPSQIPLTAPEPSSISPFGPEPAEPADFVVQP